MRFKFEWNPYADQPHNVAPRSERTRHHIRRWPTYLALTGSNIVHSLRSIELYRRYRRAMHRSPALLKPEMFGLAVSPAADASDAALDLLSSSGAGAALLRIPSWERSRLAEFEDFAGRIKARGFELMIALLQRREDVFEIGAWTSFLDEVFSRFRPYARDFEIGHAWNRTKWGVWDHAEYIELARAAAALRDKHGVRLVGPAVIDFEFHLYPPVLRAVDFDIHSSLLYVDRVGAPENGQFGWTAEMKAAAFKAMAESGAGRPRPAWITEVNWPLEGTGKYSPASGRPNVSEEAQADYLVRYYVPLLTSGIIERIYWWQLVAPGYGLVDGRETPWRPRPSFQAFRTMTAALRGATFKRRERPRGGEIFYFNKDGGEFAAAWTAGPAFEYEFPRRPVRIIGRGGSGIPASSRVRLDGSPRYIYF